MTRMKLAGRCFVAELTKRRFVAAVIVALLLAAGARAQDEKAPKADDEGVPKVEIGAQYSTLRLDGIDRSAAVGGRLTYNLSKHLSVEAEANFFPFKIIQDYVTGGHAFQTQFGVKAGRRFRRFGLFAKARPGLLTFGETATPVLGQSFIGFDGRRFFTVDFITERKTHFSLDLGGAVEVYASRRVFARFDAGDTLIRYGGHKELSEDFSNPNPIAEVGARTGHSLQFSAGVGVRLGPRGGDGGSAATSATKGGGRRSERSEEGRVGK